MPRQDVPYGGAICRLKERIAEIWDKLGEKLHSINGVEGDGAGDVKIVSGDAAVVITSDQVNHQIEVALDSSRLPAASVSSVNGQTGAVVLHATDIRTTNNTPIQTKITALEGATQTALNNINTEAQNRQAADNVLQGNINTVQASIPGAAATAVSNDPTVAQLATDVPNKVDKITSGSSLKAYTHTGVTQGETSVVDGTAANSIGIRDANGRMQAADPASGATDKTLVTANWVSQTGNSAPNNLIHKTGNENRPTGVLTTQYMGMSLPTPITASTTGVWIRWIQFNSAYSENHIVEMLGKNANNGTFYCMFAVAGGGSFSRYAKILEAGPNNAGFKVAILRNTNTNAHEIWIYAAQAQTNYILAGMKYGNPARVVEINEEYAALPTTGYTTPFYVLGSP